ncbi:MAG TPA: hypothetical protein VLT36_13105, partial [Candidatus Dormibacteraeota bacterium]|nr:hypothetical protein [Candidatus Dormibacteraeota bacterium]
RLRRLENFVPTEVGRTMGFVGMPWIEGRRLAAHDGKDAAVLEHIGLYIACAAGAPLDEREADAAVGRLTDMLLCNVKEALGDGWQTRAARLRVQARTSEMRLSYGDGRLAPHEWVRTPDGNIIKTDANGHWNDHTLVGKQSVVWDVAGAVIEWDLNDAQVEFLVRVLADCGIKVNGPALEFYKSAYLAFRIGIITFGIGQAQNDPEEQARLSSALETYKRKLRIILTV